MTQDQGEGVAADEPLPSLVEDAAAGEPHQHQEQTVHASIEPSDFEPQESQLQPDLSEEDAMAEAMKESLMQHEIEEAEKHQYDAYQLQDQEYEPDLVCQSVTERLSTPLSPASSTASLSITDSMLSCVPALWTDICPAERPADQRAANEFRARSAICGCRRELPDQDTRKLSLPVQWLGSSYSLESCKNTRILAII